jgi:exodeoxyribonuclease V gamma subunit
MDLFDSRLTVHRASRTERLADELIARLRAHKPSAALASQTIVIPHVGMRRWLLQSIAKSTPRGIAANIDTQLPWQWLQTTARRVLGDAALVGGDYNADVLRWHVHAALGSVSSPVLDAYLTGQDSARRRFQLAARLTDVFSQYLVYRPDMILRWERGDSRDDWQAQLWRRVRAGIETPHRAERLPALLEALQRRGDGETEPLHVFGVSELPPDVLASLRALATHRDIHVYFPDPCRQYWTFLRPKRAILLQEDAEALYFEVGHPLLASLGRVGQDFSLALDDADDHRDPLDDDLPPTKIHHRLHAVQESIRHLQPDLVRDTYASPDPRTDASLRVHVCHTRLRELEVLKDQLLGFLADDPTLQPRDIVVMAPDIAAYAPLLPSLFGDAARYADGSGAIPWHLADVALARTHSLFDGFARVLDLPDSRFKVSDVLDWLDIAAVARRFAFDAGARESVEPWLRRAHVAWGLDADMKGETGAAAIDANTWSFGFDRMYAGWLIGNDDASSLIVDGDIAPLSGVSGNSADVIGKLDRLIGTLRSLRDGMRAERTLSAWSEWLVGAIDAMFLADTRDDREDDAMDTLRKIANSLQSQGDAIGADETFAWSIVREAIGDALGAIPERQPFLLGGVTFCGLVPQRAIPFRVVCLLGMNAGDYPRSASDGGLNRMIAQPRRGDRDTRQQDRYLFLEALMAARQALHVSYLGEDVAEGGQRNPASPLAELLDYLDEQADIAADDEETDRPWIVRHPLQPFDARYFSSTHDPRLFSFDAAQAQRFSNPPSAFVDFNAQRADAVAETNDVPLQSLVTFWRDPAKATLRDGFGIALDALEADADADTEPLTSKPDRRERLEERLWRDAFSAGLERVPPTPPSWLAYGGLLPAGDLAARAYLRLRERSDALLGAVRESVGAGADAKEVREPVAVRVGDERIVGTIDRMFRRADGALCLLHTQASEVSFKHVLPFFIEWAMLRLSNEKAQSSAVFLACDKSGITTPDVCKRIAAQNPAQLANGLSELMSMMRLSAQSPPFLIPKTSWAWANAKDDQRDGKARSAWRGSREQKGEIAYEPSYAALLTRGSGFPDSASRGFAEFVRTNEWIARILDPSPLAPRSAGGDA